ncbi:MAG: DsrE family protein [Anaerolineae bacterium]
MTEVPSRLLVLWTSGEKETALNMVLMYTTNAKLHAWWDEVVLLVWGAASRLAAEDADVQARIVAARQAGVRVIACLACAKNMGVVEALKSQGIEVFYTGQFLSDWLKSGDKVLSV